LELEGNTHLFVGEVRGTINFKPQGENGFGYDPIFIPEGHSRTFAEMSIEEKNSISHRGRAMNKLKEFLIKK
jgi:Xanthosine triphosphate pyrophosphatase